MAAKVVAEGAPTAWTRSSAGRMRCLNLRWLVLLSSDPLGPIFPWNSAVRVWMQTAGCDGPMTLALLSQPSRWTRAWAQRRRRTRRITRQLPANSSLIVVVCEYRYVGIGSQRCA